MHTTYAQIQAQASVSFVALDIQLQNETGVYAFMVTLDIVLESLGSM